MKKYLLKVIELDKSDEQKGSSKLTKYLRRVGWKLIWMYDLCPTVFDILDTGKEKYVVLQKCGTDEKALCQFGKEDNPIRTNIKSYKKGMYKLSPMDRCWVQIDDNAMFRIKQIK